MRLLDHDEPIDPEVASSLDAIDAVLAGEPVDARYAELAEVALLLASEPPRPTETFAHSLDGRVAQRFGPASTGGGAPATRRRRSSRVVRAGIWQGAGALAAGLAVIAAIVVVAVGHGAPSGASSSAASGEIGTGAAASGAPSSAATSTSASSGSAHAAPAPASSALAPDSRAAAPSQRGSIAGGSASSSASSAPGAAAPPLQPPTTGRKVVQAAQLNLTALPNHIDDVAQEVYDVIGGLNGIVESSTVTQSGGPGGYAEFQLSVPSGSLGQAMGRLSSLNYAQVASRTDSSQDITDQYGAAQRALADARALRTSLLRQLANATTTDQVNSLKAQINDAEASISSDEATLARLNHEVGFSLLSLQITPRSAPAPVSHGSGGFGIGSAAHDAGRVLTVAAGVALIAIAALIPVALVVALVWWVGSAVLRRRREHALDLA